MNRTIDLQDHITELVNEGRALAFQLEDHFSPKLVHKMRVCVRRLRTMLSLINHPEFLPDSLQSQLKSLWKNLGKARDLDVGHELSQKYDIGSHKIKQKRITTRKKLRLKITDKKTQKLFDELEKIALRPVVSKIDPVPLLHELRMKLLRTPGDSGHLHELRIILKKIRYFAEALDFDIEPFKEFQDTLGEYHDLVVFHEKHPNSLAIRKALNNKRLKAIAIARPAVQLALKALGNIEHQFQKEMAIRAS